MRVIAGKYGSRPLRALKGIALRPTSDRLRETLFNVLGPLVNDALFVDCFAGTGAVGIEALSRGAREAIFIEKHPPATALVRKNLESLQITSGVEVITADALRGLEKLSKRRLLPDFIFLDPPYRETVEYERILNFLDDARLLAPEGRIIVEHIRRLELPAYFQNLERSRLLVHGDAALSFYRLARAA
ncbi:MAG: 16S rRNA (guanine(966)-N(2))-methyltransferase RsmD [Candidatus Acidiferrales bacterium]